MKTNQIFKMLFVAMAMLFAACEQDIPVREASPADANAGFYIFENTATSVMVSPADGGNFAIKMGSKTVISEEKKFNILIGRTSTAAADSVQLQVLDKYEAFIFDPVARFAAGAAFDTIVVEFDLNFGESADLVVTIPTDKASNYGPAEKEISVSVDYTWVSCGTAYVTQDFLTQGEPVEVSIEKAKESTDNLYRLANVFEEIAKALDPEEYMLWSTPGVDFKFTLDDEYNLASLIGNSAHFAATGWNAELLGVGSGFMEFAYSPAALEAYGGDKGNKANVYFLSTVIFEDGDGGWYFNFDWTWNEKDYPGKLVDPTEGEGVFNELTFTQGAVVANSEGDGFEVVLNDGNLKLYLELLGKSPIGEFEIVSANSAEAGDAVAGAFDGTAPTGCYLNAIFTQYYLTSGTVKVELSADEKSYLFTIDAITASEKEIKAKATIPVPTVTPDEPAVEASLLKSKIKAKKLF